MPRWSAVPGLLALAGLLTVTLGARSACSPLPVECQCVDAGAPVCDEASETTYASACDAECAGVEVFAPVACEDCEGRCAEDTRIAAAMCGFDGATYDSFCALQCAAGRDVCPAEDACPAAFYDGVCEQSCRVEQPAGAAEGERLARFLCQDANANSASFGAPISSDTLEEIVWIAYFGSCS